MRKYYIISGYWKDDKTEFEGYLVTDFDDMEADGDDEDEIFFYGLSEKDIQEAIELGENTVHDFVITSYEKA